MPASRGAPPIYEGPSTAADPGPPGTGNRRGGRSGAVIGFVVGALVAFGFFQLRLAGANFEHGAPGIGAYMIIMAFVAPLLFGFVGAFVGMLIGSALRQWHSALSR